MNTSALVEKVWDFFHILQHDGVCCDKREIERIRAERAAQVAVKKPRGIKAKAKDALA